MSQRPLVLVTPSDVVSKGGFPARSVNCNYLQGVAQAGGLPVVVAEPSCLKEYIQIADGLLLTGGVDIDPHCYGQSPIDPPEHYDQPRDDVELELAKEFIQLGKPILAICRGFQMINVALGGVLLQDIPTWCGADHSGGLRHSVELIPGSKLSSWFGTEIEVNSYHHQGIRVEELAPPLRLSAFWESNEQKNVEGYEHPSLPILGVQWHPERMLEDPKANMSVLFRWLLENTHR